MNPHELRVGNYMLSRLGRVIPVNISDILQCHVGQIELKPIEITEGSITELLGFGDKGDDGYYIHEVSKIRYNINGLYIHGDIVVDVNFIKYIHQLQNILEDATGFKF